jgi:hypothetical protein
VRQRERACARLRVRAGVASVRRGVAPCVPSCVRSCACACVFVSVGGFADVCVCSCGFVAACVRLRVRVRVVSSRLAHMRFASHPLVIYCKYRTPAADGRNASRMSVSMADRPSTNKRQTEARGEGGVGPSPGSQARPVLVQTWTRSSGRRSATARTRRRRAPTSTSRRGCRCDGRLARSTSEHRPGGGPGLLY